VFEGHTNISYKRRVAKGTIGSLERRVFEGHTNISYKRRVFEGT
jgi:hypothetical protein